jgi:hypothetical protein
MLAGLTIRSKSKVLIAPSPGGLSQSYLRCCRRRGRWPMTRIGERSWSAPLVLGGWCKGATPDRVHAERRRRVFRVAGPMPTMTALQRQSSKR